MPSFDEYIPETEEHKQSPGLYKVYQDGEGTRKIEFSSPENKPAPPAREANEAEQTMTNTDKIDDEIKQLKEKQKELRRRFNSEENPIKAEEIQNELNAVENELRQKDNDVYRRQNSRVTPE